MRWNEKFLPEFCIGEIANLRSRGRYTAHKQQLVTVRYFLHPLYEQELAATKELNFATGKVFLVRFFDNTLIHLPAWMVDPVYCRGCHVQEQPECSLAALRSLRTLLDGLAL